METTILLVEDDLLILHSMAMGLANAGYRILEADSAEAAMRICTDNRPDIALLDICLPDMSGIDFARWLIATLDVPFLFLSAYNDPDIVSTAIELGAFGFLVKPLNIPQVLPSLQTALRLSKNVQELQQTENDLKTAFKTNRIINLATGLLMYRFGTGATETFDAFRSYCRSKGRKMIDVADMIVEHRQEIDLTHYIK
jgi:response regulator NasT